jgi:hypothetical protein
LKRIKDDTEKVGATVAEGITDKIKFFDTVDKALKTHKVWVRNMRACELFNMDYQQFFPENEPAEDADKLIKISEGIYDAVSTQAFQLGYVMAVFSIAELLLSPEDSYETRLTITTSTSSRIVASLNNFFSENGSTIHRTFTGLVTEPRVNVFSNHHNGLRGLLNMSLASPKIDEKEWVFFRYAICEVIFSKYNKKFLEQFLQERDSIFAERFSDKLELLLNGLKSIRNLYIDKAVARALSDSNFTNSLEMERITMEANKISSNEIEAHLNKKKEELEANIKALCANHINASLGAQNTLEKAEGLLLTPA